MKTVLIIAIALISFAAKSQEITVFYKEKMQPAQVSTRHEPIDLEELSEYKAEIRKIVAAMSADKDKDSTEIFRKMMQDQADKMSAHSMKIARKPLKIPTYDYITVLKINHEKSLYYPQEKVSNDTLSETRTNKNGSEFTRERINYNNSEIIYIDQSQNKKISALKVHVFDNRGRLFLIEEVLETQEWILTKETKKIDQYVCYKAILNNSERKVEAWYAKEIKSTNGPKGYHGLPGLILELKEGRKTIRFHEINLLSSESMDIKPPTEGEKVTRQELEDLPSKLFNQY
ncbi:GLPGLI family protein [uncultured Aquimarina sp.]|uniref:GLPGLI family protein n=1 Tax=uncultured Aquimarina sp. TaxID=575652 RepID=UPI002615A3C5|nr:GLPGLI family protein [uncultured Aquimarina sp.]